VEGGDSDDEGLEDGTEEVVVGGEADEENEPSESVSAPMMRSCWSEGLTGCGWPHELGMEREGFTG
jgi:hypothetical protein